MASDPITSWQIDVEIMEKMRDFIFGGSKTTADDATLMAENEEELKSLLIKVKEESEKVGYCELYCY